MRFAFLPMYSGWGGSAAAAVSLFPAVLSLFPVAVFLLFLCPLGRPKPQDFCGKGDIAW
jgi:hypothetical protein